MGLREIRLVIACAAVSLLTACSNFGISAPTDGSLIKSPPPTPVTITANPSMTSLVVKLNGTDVTSSMTATSGSVVNGSVMAPAGKLNVLTADANVDCWYCSPKTQQMHHQVTFCVAPASGLGSMSKTAFANGDKLSWSKTSDTAVGVAQDQNTFVTQWNLIRLGGITSSTGLISSTQDSCLCMRSMDTNQNTPIGLALCDPNDSTQQWQALQIPNTGNAYRVQNTGRAISDACLTEGNNNVLVQRACNDQPNQLWTFKDLTTGTFGSPF